MENKKFKEGTTVISVAITLCISVMLLCTFLAFSINCIMPFILQQKLQMIATKYMYVIERYGYFTKEEKNFLVNELKNSGFDVSRISVEAPDIPKQYGQIIELGITYKYTPIISLGMEEKIINVKRVSYSKT